MGDVRADWIAVDWGTTHLRAWAMRDHGEASAEAQSDQGMGGLSPEEFEPALLALVEPWLTKPRTEVLVAGMAGSRQGWIEAPYSAAPCAPPLGMAVRASSTDQRIAVQIVPGIKQDNPADVMRGEETQIAGFLAQNDGFDGVICLPGTHTKWVHISAGEVVSFRTFMTGELYACLSEGSVLRHSVGAGWDKSAFETAVSDTLTRPETLAANLFGIRAESLLHGLQGDAARARLSGLLVGAELAAARVYWLGQRVAVIGAQAISTVYAEALAAQAVDVMRADGAEMTRAGLTAARAELVERAT